jgi:hypothetical protein
MQWTRKSLLAITIATTTVLALVMVGQRNIAQADDEGCNTSTVKGTYGFALGGFVSTTFNGAPQQVGEFVPLAAAGTFFFDGHGSTSRSFTVSFGGATFPASDSGPYSVNRDCTLSATYPDGTWSMVIIGRGKEIKAVNTAPGTAVQGVLTRQ